MTRFGLKYVDTLAAAVRKCWNIECYTKISWLISCLNVEGESGVSLYCL